MSNNTLTDLQKRQLLAELYIASESYDMLLAARTDFVEAIKKGYQLHLNSNILLVTSAVLHYLAKRNLAICLQLSESEIARVATLRTARQLGYSEQALKAVQ